VIIMRELLILLLALLFLPIIVLLIPVLTFFHFPCSRYWKTIAIGIDQFGGSVLYGQENLTVSSYTHFLCMTGNKAACVFEKFINFFFGKDHCKKAFEWEVLNDSQELKRFLNESG